MEFLGALLWNLIRVAVTTGVVAIALKLGIGLRKRKNLSKEM